jgi:peptidyl-dipeptidase A
MTPITTVLDETEQQLAPLERRYCLAEWDAAVGGDESAEDRVVEASLALEAVLSDPERFAALEHAAAPDDPIGARRLTVLLDESRAFQRPRALAERIVRLEASLQTLYSKHRGKVGGREVSNNDIDMILRESTDPDERRAAWDASKEIGPKAAVQVRELARLRNEAARGLGYRDHFAMSLELQELDEGWLFGLLDQLESSLAEPWAAEKAAIDDAQRARLGIPADQALRPWDYADAFFQDAPLVQGDGLEAALAALDPLTASRAYFTALGDPIDEILERSDLYPRDAKHQGAFCIQIDRADDVRILANVEPGERWLSTMLHELGHGVYDIAIERDLPWLLRRHAHIFATEAIAMLHGRVTRDPTFLRTYCGLAGELADAPFNTVFVRRALHVLTAWVQVMTRFERALYADPDGDLGTIWWDLVERYQQVRRPDGSRPDDWASKLHIALAPVYYHNYLLGEITASQIEWALERETGSASPAGAPTAAGAFLRDRFMRLGASRRWDELIEHATGSPLVPDHFVRLLSRSAGA